MQECIISVCNDAVVVREKIREREGEKKNVPLFLCYKCLSVDDVPLFNFTRGPILRGGFTLSNNRSTYHHIGMHVVKIQGDLKIA